MSTVQASNISDGTTAVGTEYVVNGAAKSWVNFDGTGTVAIRDSLNTSSITDNGTGNYTINFSTSMEDTNYSTTFGTIWQSGVSFNLINIRTGTTPTTSSFNIDTKNSSAGGTDCSIAMVSVQGNI